MYRNVIGMSFDFDYRLGILLKYHSYFFHERKGFLLKIRFTGIKQQCTVKCQFNILRSKININIAVQILFGNSFFYLLCKLLVLLEHFLLNVRNLFIKFLVFIIGFFFGARCLSHCVHVNIKLGKLADTIVDQKSFKKR